MNKMKNKTLAKATGLLRSREASLMLVMILLVAVIQWRSGGMFLSGTVISQLTQNYAYTMVLSLGMLLSLPEFFCADDVGILHISKGL